MQTFRKFVPVGLFAGLFAFAIACGDPAVSTECGDGTCDSDESCETCVDDCGVCPPACNNDNVCDADEDVTTCADCRTSCDLPTMTGDVNNFLLKTMFIPDSATAALENGVDLNGDGVIDNKLGSIISLLAQQGMDDDINVLLNQEIADGGLLLVARLTDSGLSDNVTAVQVLLAEVTGGATPTFGGNDTVALDSGFDASIYLCGEWEAPNLQAGPDDLPFAIPLPDIGTINVTLENAMVMTDTDLFADAAATTSGLTNVVVGGGISKEQIDNDLIPFVVDFLADMIADDPTGSTATTILGLFDNNCDETICPDAATHADCADDDVLTAKELQCNMLLNTALAPDVDIDGDGENDLLSLGLTLVDAVPVTVIDATP